MKLHIHGVHVPNRKNTAELAALRLPIPETVEIPMSMHIGAPAIPVVKPGESVRVGQLIGKAGGFVSAPVYASVSGTVKKIGQQVGSGGRLMQTVVIAADGKQEPDPDLKPPKLDTMQDFLDAVRESGMVGLGGAGFPTVVKLTVKNLEQVKAVIINGAECEPYITSDTRTMLDRSEELVMEAYAFSLYQSLGVYLSLIVVNCIILGRAEMYASKHGVVDSAIDGAGMGLGFTLAICAMAAIRETLGCGTFCGLPVPWFHENPIGILTMAPGGFFVFGCMIALINKISKGKAIKKKEFGCAGCPGCGKGACEGKEAAAK